MTQENLQSVLSSEHKVAELINQLDLAINEIESLESQLCSYDEILGHVRTTIEKMEQKNILIQIVNKNNEKLLSRLEKVVVRFDSFSTETDESVPCSRSFTVLFTESARIVPQTSSSSGGR